jgi:hypothetical protein
MVGNGVEVFGADHAVQTLEIVRIEQALLVCKSYHDEGVVQNEHDGREPKGPSVVPEDHLTQIANISNLWVAHTELP